MSWFLWDWMLPGIWGVSERVRSVLSNMGWLVTSSFWNRSPYLTWGTTLWLTFLVLLLLSWLLPLWPHFLSSSLSITQLIPHWLPWCLWTIGLMLSRVFVLCLYFVSKALMLCLEISAWPTLSLHLGLCSNVTFTKVPLMSAIYVIHCLYCFRLFYPSWNLSTSDYFILEYYAYIYLAYQYVFTI